MDLRLEKGWLNSGLCRCSPMSSPRFPAHVACSNTPQEDRDHGQCLPADPGKCTICSQCSSPGSHLPKATSHLALLPLKGAVQGWISCSSSGGSRTRLRHSWRWQSFLSLLYGKGYQIPLTDTKLWRDQTGDMPLHQNNCPIPVSLLRLPSMTTSILFLK